MFLNHPDREVVNLAQRKGFCYHALAAGATAVVTWRSGEGLPTVAAAVRGCKGCGRAS